MSDTKYTTTYGEAQALMDVSKSCGQYSAPLDVFSGVIAERDRLKETNAELLEALENLAMFYKPSDGSDARALADAHAAIAKAKGEEQ